MSDPVREALLNITAQIGYDKIKELVAEIRHDGYQESGDDQRSGSGTAGQELKTDDGYVLEVKEIYQWLLNASHTIDRVAPPR